MKMGFFRNLVLLAALSGIIIASGAHATDPASDQLSHPSCQYCGMDRVKFAHSRVLIEYDDGTVVGTCSLHCAAIDLSLKIDKTPVALKVADYNTKKLIDAESAYWITGGTKMGVMTKRAKWAFSDENSALDYISANGGVLTEFSNTIKAAYQDMYEDVRMIRAKRSRMKNSHKS